MIPKPLLVGPTVPDGPEKGPEKGLYIRASSQHVTPPDCRISLRRHMGTCADGTHTRKSCSYYGGTKDPHTNPKRQRGAGQKTSLTLRVGVRIFRAAVIEESARVPGIPDRVTMKASSREEWFGDLVAGYAAYYLTTLPVLFGVLFGTQFLYPPGVEAFVPGANPLAACTQFDAVHYLDICRHGYSYDPAQRSLVAFFPAYPLLCRWIDQATGLPPREVALLTANLSLLGAFVLLARYVRLRWPEATGRQRVLVLAVFGLWPLGLFFRMPYAEGLFVCSTLAVLYGMAKGWSLLVLALLTGFATAVRPVGVALTAAFTWHVLTQPECRPWAKAGRVLLLLPLACWGLLAYMGYQWLAFDAPWAFAQTQEHWRTFMAPEDASVPTKFWSLVTLEPIWGVYVPGSQRYWGNASAASDPWLNLYFWNPILFVLAGALLLLGGWKRWLTGSELVLGACLLGIPYLTRSYEMSMASHGRFAAVVVVNYLVLGRLLTWLPSLAVVAVGAVLALFLGLFTRLYVGNGLVF